MISLKDYAQKNRISYEAVRKQVNRYRNELGEHLIKKGRAQYLDETAEAFLDERRATNPIVIIESDKNERLEALENENTQLLIKIAAIQDELIRTKEQLLQEKDTVKQLQLEKIELLEDKNSKTKKRFFWQK